MPLILRPGSPYPLGATPDSAGVNFAVASMHATRVDVCLFDEATGAAERETVTLPSRSDHVFHGRVEGIGPGQLYGLRVHGPYEPRSGHRFNPHKLLLDPYARAVANEVDWKAPMYAFQGRDDDPSMDTRDNAAGAPKGVVVDGAFDWGNDALPARPWRDTVIYELHVKGFTRRHPGVPPEARGTYAGLASEAAIAHLTSLGVTAVELLPIHEIADEPEVIARGLRNYWGYSTLGFFAPAGRYASGGRRGEQVREFKRMVKALHAAGIEVILDVVYNHTAEGHHLGPTLSLRGIDNSTYYKLSPRDPRLYVDFTGCGNSVDACHPEALRLVMDSLRYWATEMHVDGFRFDLATTLARSSHAFDLRSAFLAAVHQDPVLATRKLIAEPWDVGDGGYQVGGFPARWSEWNGRYRDAVRRFWKGHDQVLGELGFRLTGSSDLYQGGGRRPQASVNFVTAHDGFTLRDLVSYERKHNEANGERNRDGNDSNDSENHGVEGETDDPHVNALRAQQVRNLMATLFLSQGVPMLVAGDEMGRTQGGNNNAYCQDNETSWVDWDLDAERRALLDFTRRLAALRAEEPALRRERFFSGAPAGEGELPDITWLHPEGREMRGDDWNHPGGRAIGMLLGGEEGRALLMLMNAGDGEITFVLPAITATGRWEVVLDTRGADAHAPSRARKRCPMLGKTMVVMRRRA